MSHGRGAALLAASQSDVEIREYSPLEIKQSVVGKGRASKIQVQQMVGILLSMRTLPKTDHESDALACALCHAFRARAAGQLAAADEVGENDEKALKRKEVLLLASKRGRRRRR